MKHLIGITKEPKAPHSLYLAYDRGLTRVRTISLDGDEHYVNVDFAEGGEVLGIEVVFPNVRSFELIGAFAKEHGLELPSFLPSFAASA